MSIIVRDINGKSININVRIIDSIQSLKEKIYSRTGISINDQVLSFAGKYLENYRKIYEYNILRNSILSLNLGLKGGLSGSAGSGSAGSGGGPFQAGSPNTQTKNATVGVGFTYIVANDGVSYVTAATLSGQPATMTSNITANVLSLFYTPTLGDVSSSPYTVSISATSAVGTTGVNSFNFTLNVSSNVACIVSGQRILTPNGYKLIDNIYNGDIITTSLNKDVIAFNYKEEFKFTTNDSAPYIIPRDSIYPSYPPKDIFLSANHKIKTNYNWVTPKELSKYNSDVRQINVGKPLTYYNIETPNYSTDHLVLEGTTIESFWVKGNINLLNIHDNTL